MEVRHPRELKTRSLQELQILAEEIRQKIVSACLSNGGHLGASLGAVELAIALHFVFESPSEPLIWDVGHQAYAHKLLTGRWDRFQTLRQTDGISGFLSRDESEHDVFGAGHSSTSVSAALAMSYARAGTDQWSVAIVGDGGLTAGVAFEALNNVKSADGGPLLVVLNDNQMSISQNVGALSGVFAGGEAKTFFELFGFEYVGPVDGHDLGTLIGTLQAIRESGSGKPVLLHALTQKGKGYAPAEESPATYHGVSPVVEKVLGKTPAPKQKSYSDAFGEALCELAEQDEKIVAISAAMPEGTGLLEFARRFPKRFFDVGIAEPHAVTFAAGLATQGFKPVVAIYSTFLQRSLDAIIHDVGLQGLGVTFAIDRAGIVGADGPTHHGMFDLAYLGMIPGMTISAPTSLDEVKSELAEAVRSGKPRAVRYPRGSGPVSAPQEIRPERPQIIVAALGSAYARSSAAAKAVDPKGEQIASLAVNQAKPINPGLIRYLDSNPQAHVLILEDGVVRGGFGEAVKVSLAPRAGKVELLGYADHFIGHGSPSSLEEREGLSTKSIASKLQGLLG